MITQEEYINWLRYFKFQEPDSLEIQLATLSHLVAIGLGSKDSKIEDFIIHKPENDIIQQENASTGIEQQITSVFSGIAVLMD